MSKFTPGPWVSDGCYLRGENGEPDIARIYQPMGMPDEERSANARLIAAAPEMADALADCVEALGHLQDSLAVRVNPPTLEAARALLARINGESQ